MNQNQTALDRLNGLLDSTEQALAEFPAVRPVLMEPLEPVHELLRQGVTHHQIALHIYGRRGAGPFVNGLDQTARVDLLERQAAYEREVLKNGTSEIEPVIPADWIPPWIERQRGVATEQSQVRQQLKERLLTLASRL